MIHLSLEYNGVLCDWYDIRLFQMPTITKGQKRYSSITVPGFNGSFIEDDNTSDNITISCVFSLIRDVRNKERTLRTWLKGDGYVSIERDFSYRVVMINFGNLDYKTPKYGEVQVDFICLPYEYEKQALKPMFHITSALEIYNPYDNSYPLYDIEGNGQCTLTINKKVMKVNVSESVTIDTFRQLAFNKEGNYMNTDVTGDYDDIILKSGQNNIKVSEGFQLKITPNWGYRL